MKDLFMKRLVAGLVLASWFVQPALAVSVSSWTDLQSAVNRGESDIVVSGTASANGGLISIAADKTINISGGTLDGGNSYRMFSNYGDLTLNNTIQNAKSSGANTAGSVLVNYGHLTIGSDAVVQNNTNDYWGGALHQEYGSMDISNGAKFISNTTTGSAGYGGAINIQSGTVTIADGNASKYTLFQGNNAKSGGAIFNKLNEYQTPNFVSYNAAYGGNTTLNVGKYTQFINNKATGGDGGGAIQNQSVLAIGENVLFDGNSANWGGAISNIRKNLKLSAVGGGTVVHDNASYLSLIIDDAVTFKSNSATGGGGAIYTTGGIVEIKDNVVFGGANVADGNTAGSYGGAIFNNTGTVKIANNVSFENNKATAATSVGGAIVNMGTMSIADNVSFSKNSSGTLGGAVYNAANLTIGNAAAFGSNTTLGSGGAIANIASLEIGSNSTFTNNKADGAGGAINNSAAGTLTIGENALFKSNTSATNGGAIFNQGILNVSSGATFENNSMTALNNTGSSTAGGAVSTYGKTTIGNNVTFKNNASNTQGGGLFIKDQNGTNTSVTIGSGAKFENNSAYLEGGGLQVAGNATVEIGENAEFVGNKTLGNGTSTPSGTGYGMGGAISVVTTDTLSDPSKLTLGKNASFTNNSANYGGAINIADTSSTVNLKGGTTFTGNTAVTSGGAIYNKGNLNLDSTDGNITFSENKVNGVVNDIYMKNDAVMNLIGDANKIIFGGGVSGYNNTGVINKTGLNELVLNGDSSEFKGAYIQTDGTTTVGGKFFGGENTINGGSLNVGTGGEIVSGSTVNLNNDSSIAATDGATISGDVNMGGTSSIVTTGNVTIDGALKSALGSNTSITNSGHLSVGGDQSGYLGKYTQNSGTTEVLDDAIFFGGISDINGGSFIFNELAKLAAGSTVNINNEDVVLSILGSHTINGNKIDVNGGSFTLNNATISGDTKISEGTMTDTNLKFIDGAGFSTGANNVTLDGSTVINLADGSIAEGKSLTINENAVLNLSSKDLEFKIDALGNGIINVGKIKDTDTPDIAISSDNSAFEGNFLQSDGNVTMESGSKFFGGTNFISGGTTEFLANSTVAGQSIISGTAEVTINEDVNFADGSLVGLNGGKLNFDIANGKETTLTNNIVGNGGEVNKIGEGVLNISGVPSYSGTFNQKEGTTKVADGGSFFSGVNNILGGVVEFLSGSKLAGTNNISAGELKINNGADASGGSLAFGDSSTGKLTLNNDNASDKMSFGSAVAGTSGTIQKTGAGELALTNADNSAYKGTFENIAGKTTVLGKFFGGQNNVKGGELALGDKSEIVSGSTVDIASGASMTIAENAKTIINGAITGEGDITNAGDLTFSGNGEGFTGDFNQTGGKTTITSGATFLAGANSIIKGIVALEQGASLKSDINVKDYSVSFDLYGREFYMSSHGIEIIGANGEKHYITGSLNLQNTEVKVDEATGVTSDIYIANGSTINNEGAGTSATVDIGKNGENITLSLGAGAVTTEEQSFNIGDGSTINLTPNKGGSLNLLAQIEGGVDSDILVDGTQMDISDPNSKYDVGNVILNADNSGFLGTYTQKDGDVRIADGSTFFGGTNVIEGGSLTAADGALLSEDVVVDGTAKAADSVVSAPIFKAEGSLGEVTQDRLTNGNFNYANTAGSDTDNVQINQGGLGLANGTVITEMVDNTLELNSMANGVRYLELSNGSGVEGNIQLNSGTGLGYGDNAYIKEGTTLTMDNAELIFNNNKTHINYNNQIIGDGVITQSGAGSTNVSNSEAAVLDVKATNGTLNFINKNKTALSDVNVTNNATVNVASNTATIGDVNVTGKDATMNIFGDATIGNTVIKEATLGIFGNSTMGDLSLGSTLNMMGNKQINNLNTGAIELTDTSNITFDADVRNNLIDTINGSSFTDNGNKLIITGIDFVNSPIDKQFQIDTNKLVQVGGSSAGANIELKDGSYLATTEMGRYLITSTGSTGILGGTLTELNPQMYRAQVATVASYANQLVVNNMLFDHMGILGRQLLAEEKANVYAAAYPQFAPYQYSKKDGGLWYKAYGNFETISMTQGLNVRNNAYGSLIGADFPLKELGNGWNMVPTAYIAYNGAHQTFNGVGMYQNGAQLGAMGTVYKGDFITSLLAYGGGYANDMSVKGQFGSGSDTTGNWFAGVASKTAYNIKLPADFILQPTALVSYNIFGSQNFGSNFGAMSMNSGMLNGVNVAPGVNLIWAKKTFSLYATAQMVFNIMGDVGGKAGNIDLNDVGMRHGYFEYGIGAMKKFKDKFTGYLQITVRNGGRTGIGFQGGLQWKVGK